MYISPNTLLCDFGNSRLKFAATDGKRLFDYAILECGSDARGGECLAHACYSTHAEAIWIASVRDDAFNRLLEKTTRQMNLPMTFASARFDAFGMRSDYDEGNIGVDRFLAILAARDLCDDAYIVIDCGTATTVDFVDAAGCHQGGYILPGSNMMRGSLSDGTARLPTVEASDETPTVEASDETPTTLPRDTRAAIEQGCSQALRHALRGLAREQHAPRDAQVIITGGNAPMVMQDEWLHKPQLVIEGLARYAQVMGE